MLKERLFRLRCPGRRALLIGLAVLIVLLGVGGGLWLLARQPQHVTTIPNQGNSLLYISASGQGNGYEDTLTMIRPATACCSGTIRCLVRLPEGTIISFAGAAPSRS